VLVHSFISHSFKMTFTNAIAFSLLAAGSALASPIALLKPRAASGLNDAIVASGKLYFGSATDNPELTNTSYVKELNNTADFGQITPGNSMKWDAIEPERGTFTYTEGDVIADLAQENGQKLRCHNLVWYNQLPSWVSSGGFDNATLIEIMKNHITNEVTHYKGQCYAWDVVNEALSDNGDGSYRSNVFYETIGEAYIPIAFAAAAAADPNVKLYYNDYSIEYAGAKSTAAQGIVKMVQAYGAKIDGVGLQSHFIVGETPSTESQVSNMKAFTALGVDVAITELDIRTTTPETSSAETQQAKDYSSTISACMQVEKCVGVTIWDWTDKYSWIPSTFSGYGAALPWDTNFNKKVPIYDVILSAASNGSSSSAATSSTSAAASILTSASSVAASTSRSASSAAATASTSSSVSPVTSTAVAVAATSASSSKAASATSASLPATSSVSSSIRQETSTSLTSSTSATSSSIASPSAGSSGPAPNDGCLVEYVYF
jgi:endo-1,4-beta-xylanase